MSEQVGIVMGISVGAFWIVFYVLNGYFDIFRFAQECF